MTRDSVTTHSPDPIGDHAPGPVAAHVPHRWRPPLALLAAGAVGAAIALPTFGMAAVVALSRSPEALIESLQTNLLRIALAEIIILVCAGLVAYVLWRALALPIETLVARTEAAARRGARFDARGRHGTREIARLAESFAVTVEELQRRSRYLETFTAHLAHELKSPLTAIQGAAELLGEDDMPAARRRAFAANIEADARRLTQLVTRLRDLARADLREPHDARGSCQGTPLSATLAALADAAGLDLDLAAPDVLLPLDAASAEVVLRHIVDNARRHGARRLTVTGPRCLHHSDRERRRADRRGRRGPGPCPLLYHGP